MSECGASKFTVCTHAFGRPRINAGPEDKPEKKTDTPRIWRMQNKPKQHQVLKLPFSFRRALEFDHGHRRLLSQLVFFVCQRRPAATHKHKHKNITATMWMTNTSTCARCRFLRRHTHSHRPKRTRRNTKWNGRLGEPISLPVAFDFVYMYVYQFAQCAIARVAKWYALIHEHAHHVTQNTLEGVFVWRRSRRTVRMVRVRMHGHREQAQ